VRQIEEKACKHVRGRKFRREVKEVMLYLEDEKEENVKSMVSDGVYYI
jgi:hypothetical protein